MIPDCFPRDTIDQKATVPPGDFFIPQELQTDHAETAFFDKIDELGPDDALIITHNDADGLTSGVYMANWAESVLDVDSVVIPTSYRGAGNLPHLLRLLNDDVATPPGHVFITDLGQSLFEDAEPHVKALYPDTDVYWIDHHQWDSDELSELRSCAHGVIDDSMCATRLVTELRDDNHPTRFPLTADGTPDEQLELSRVVNDLDLWIKDDPRSDRIAVFAEYADDDEYMTAALDGIDLLDRYDDEISAYETENQALLDRAVSAADFTTIAGLDVAFTYGYGPSASMGNDLVENEGADLAVVIRPNGSLSFYAHSDENGFTKCHKVAAEFGGGGHPTAAGGNLQLDTFDEHRELWATRMKSHRDAFQDAIEAVVPGTAGK